MADSVVGAYRLLEEIGSGDMGKVYRAQVVGRVEGIGLGSVVALKIVHPHLLRNEGFFKRFLREGAIGKRVRHPNVVATFDLDVLKVGAETLLYVAMEHVEGQTLASLLSELGPCSEELCIHVGRAVARALAAIHAAGVVHRDLKPENVIVTRDHVVKVMDLGVARVADEAVRLSQTGDFKGSTGYAAPEQITDAIAPHALRSSLSDDDAPPPARRPDASVDGRADLYSLGLILYELATGLHPFRGIDAVKRYLDDAPQRIEELNPQVSPFFEEVVHTLLAKNPADRFQSAQELEDVLSSGQRSTWWRRRAHAIRLRTLKPLRRVHVPRETAIFGRDRELAELTDAWIAAKAGVGQVVLVQGDAGIGKTRLVDEFVTRLEEAGEAVTYLCGAFPSGGAATGASAFTEALRTHFATGDIDFAVAPHLARMPILVPAFAALLKGDRPPAGSEPLTAESMQSVFVQVIRSLAASQPVICLCDDLHLAPEQGRSLFAALAMAIPRHRVLLVGSARPGLPESWTSSFTRRGGARHIALTRLGIKDLARLVIAAVGSERVADELGFQVVTKSEGNPFYLFEILRSLRDQGALVKDGERWALVRPIRELSIPASLKETVKARIALLTDDEREAMEVAACCGFEFDPRLVGDAMRIDRITLLKRLARIERAHRLVHSLGDHYVFDHDELRESLWTGLPELLRAEYHGLIAEAIESRVRTAIGPPGGSIIVELTSHFLAAGRPERARPYLAAALDHLDRIYASDVAVDLAARALAAPGVVTGPERLTLLCGQADRLDLLARLEEERAVLDEARRIADDGGGAAARAAVRIRMARSCRGVARYEEASALATEAQDIAVAADDRSAAADALGILGDVLGEVGRYDEARERHELEVALRREAGDVEGEAAATGKLGRAVQRLGFHDEAYALFRRDQSLNRTTGSRLGKALVKRNLGGVLFSLGRYEDARRQFAKSLSLSRLIGFRRGEAAALVGLGEACLMLGNRDEAARHLQAAARLCRETGVMYVEGQALAALATLALAAGDPVRAFRRAKRAERLRREIGDEAGLVASLLTLGRLRKLAGAVPFARAAFVEARALAAKLVLPGEEMLARVLAETLPGGDAPAAAAALGESEMRLCVRDRMEARHLLWQATGDYVQLIAAKRLLDHVLAHVPPARADQTLAGVPLHRNVAGSAAVVERPGMGAGVPSA